MFCPPFTFYKWDLGQEIKGCVVVCGGVVVVVRGERQEMGRESGKCGLDWEVGAEKFTCGWAKPLILCTG